MSDNFNERLERHDKMFKLVERQIETLLQLTEILENKINDIKYESK